MSDPSAPYGSTAKRYLKLGWFPVPVAGKAYPEPGTTGKKGTVTADSAKALVDSRRSRNVAIRHDGTIALDVDGADHGGKRGDLTLAKRERKLGALPATYSSTARGDDSPTRQRFFRLPEGFDGKLVSDLGSRSDVEVIHHDHRYSVVAPSVHPDNGAEYRWYDPSGRVTDLPPHVDELPLLPRKWLEALTVARYVAPATEHRPVPTKLDHGRRGGYLHTALTAELDRLDAMRDGATPDPASYRGEPWDATTHKVACNLVELANAEWNTLTHEQAYEAFIEHAPRDGGFDPEAKWKAALATIGDKARPTPDLIVAPEVSTLPLPRESAKGLLSPAERQRATQAEVSPWVNVSEALGGDMTPPAPDAGGVRADGSRMLYRGTVNGIVGEPEAGKGLTATAMATDELQRGGSIVWVDVDHNGAASILGRLREAGVADDVLGNPERFRLAVPDSRDVLAAAIRSAAATPPTLAVIDSVGEVMSMHGAKSNDDGDYTRVHRAVFTPLADAGAAVLVLDHLAKTALTTGYASGTGAKKRAMDGAYYGINIVEAFRPGVGGAAALKILKDRHGGVRAATEGDTAAVFRLDSRGGAMTWEFWPGKSDERRLDDRARADLEFVLSLDPLPTSRLGVIDAVKAETGKGWAKDRADAALKAAREHLSSSFPIDPENNRTTNQKESTSS
ncbi:bifunctional DNA primase/polymerase [Microbacterium sp. P01]|uniref:bifunctional DNA primase/polymerase n=1 Tax=Microbacterium sp. P01 TaxID=3366261 RepID=UPI003671F71B